MQIQFQTKEQSNQQQLNEFILLPKYLRFFAFIELSKKINTFPSKHKHKDNDNFVINLTSKNGKLG